MSIPLINSISSLYLNRVLSPLINGGSNINYEFLDLIENKLIYLLNIANKITEITEDPTFSLLISNIIPKNLKDYSKLIEIVKLMSKFYKNLEYKIRPPKYIILSEKNSDYVIKNDFDGTQNPILFSRIW